MNNKNYTSIEQSKHLLELGLKAETADIFIPYYGGEDYAEDRPYFREHVTEPDKGDLPCWSTDALLELIPSYLGEFEDGIDFGLSKACNNQWFCAHYLQMKEDDNGKLLMKGISTVTGKTPIEALYKLVCWLIENNYIKTV